MIINRTNIFYPNSLIYSCRSKKEAPADVSSCSFHPVPDKIQIPAMSAECLLCFPNFSSSSKRIFSSGNKKLKETTSAFKLAKFDGITCPACGKKMISGKRYLNICKELDSVPPDQYLDILKKYTGYMRPVEESVFNEIYALAQQKEASKDIHTLVMSLRSEKLPMLQHAQMQLVKKMYALSKTLPENEKQVLQAKLEKLKKYIYKKNSEAPFRRKILIDKISRIKIKNPVKYAKLQQIAQKFPSSADMNSAWIIKYSGKNKYGQEWSSLETAKRLMYASSADTDHILAYNIENNHDDLSNYLAMHRGCNSQKSNKTFLQWINENPERIKFLQQYFDDADAVIKKKIKRKKYRNYTQEASDTIRRLTGGRVKLNINGSA